MIRNLLLVALGGALGSLIRYLLTYFTTLIGASNEWTILLINIIGSFLIGILIVLASGELYLFAAVGFCGGFTTFSTFSLQALQLFQSGQRFAAMLYVSGSVILSILFVFVGMYFAENVLK